MNEYTYPYQIVSGGFLSTTIPLSVDQLNNIQTTPVPALPPPGVGKQYIIHSTFYNYNFVTTGYTGGGGMQLWYGSSISADIGDQEGIFQQSSSCSIQTLSYSAYNFSILDTSICENCPMFLWSPNSSYTGGDGTGSVTIFYSVLQLL